MAKNFIRNFMIKFIMTVCIFILFKSTKGKNEEDINIGASISSANDDEQLPPLSTSETCEINNYVNNAIYLVFEEMSGGNDRGINVDIAEEAERSVYVAQISDSLRYGPRFAGDRESAELLRNYRQRREYYTATAVNNVLDRLMDNLLRQSSECVSENHRDQEIFDRRFLLEPIAGIDFYNTMFEMLKRLGLTHTEINRGESSMLDELFSTNENLRFKRSLEQKNHKCYSIEKFSEKRWNEFILYLTRTFIKFKSANESTSWSCDFMFLYDIYKNQLSNYKFKNNCYKINFGGFLYSKIFNMQDWNNCIDFGKFEKPDNWCQAWRRIMLNSKVGNLKKNKLSGKFKNDLKIIINWLKTKVFMENKISKISTASAQSKVCYLDATSLTCPNNCRLDSYQIKSAREKRALLWSEDIYEREWFKDSSDTLNCKCPKNNGTSHPTSTDSKPKSGNWFSRMFGTKCDDDSPDRETPRCDELRR